MDSLSFQYLVKQSKVEYKQGHQSKSNELSERASALYKGELLPHNDDSWVLPAREKLQEAYLSLRNSTHEDKEMQSNIIS